MPLWLIYSCFLLTHSFFNSFSLSRSHALHIRFTFLCLLFFPSTACDSKESRNEKAEKSALFFPFRFAHWTHAIYFSLLLDFFLTRSRLLSFSRIPFIAAHTYMVTFRRLNRAKGVLVVLFVLFLVLNITLHKLITYAHRKLSPIPSLSLTRFLSHSKRSQQKLNDSLSLSEILIS